jgi:hypothetical protein
MDPSRSVTSFRTAWGGGRKNSKVQGRWHDARDTLITELAESGAGDETIMAIAGHVSRQMVGRYSHIRTQAKRNALEEAIKSRQAARDLNAAEKEAEQAKVGPPNGELAFPLRRVEGISLCRCLRSQRPHRGAS